MLPHNEHRVAGPQGGEQPQRRIHVAHVGLLDLKPEAACHWRHRVVRTVRGVLRVRS